MSRTRAATEAANSALWERDLDAYLSAGEFAPARRASREQVLRRYIEWARKAEARTPRGVRREHIQRFEAALRGEPTTVADGLPRAYAPATVKGMLSRVRAWHRFLAQERGYPDPFAGVTTKPLGGSAVPSLSVLSPQEIALLRDVRVVDTPEGRRNHALLHLLCATGARPGELVALRPFDFSARRGTLRLGSGGASRTLLLDASARGALRHYTREGRAALLRGGEEPRRGRPLHNTASQAPERSRAPLLVARGGRPLSAAYVQFVVRNAARSADLPDWVRPATIRASLAAHQLRAGNTKGNMEVVRRSLGGKSALSFERHARLAGDTLRQAASLHPRA